MKEEEKKFRLRYLCNKIFKIGPEVSFTSEEKDDLLIYIFFHYKFHFYQFILKIICHPNPNIHHHFPH